MIMVRVYASLIVFAMFICFAGTSFAIHTEVPAETVKEDVSGNKGQMPPFRPSPEFYRVQALINLLVQKGIITKEEFREEVLRMKMPQK